MYSLVLKSISGENESFIKIPSYVCNLIFMSRGEGRAGARVFDWEGGKTTQFFKMFGPGTFGATKISLFGPFFANIGRGGKNRLRSPLKSSSGESNLTPADNSLSLQNY